MTASSVTIHTPNKVVKETLDTIANLWFDVSMFDAASGDRREDFATDAETVTYWLGHCRDALSRAAEIRRAKRGLNNEMRARRL